MYLFVSPDFWGGVLAFTINTESVKAKTSISQKKLTIYEGKSKTLKVKSPTDVVKWKSNKPKVAFIAKKSGAKKNVAMIVGLKKGKAIITAKVGSKNFKVKVMVKKKKHVHSYTIPANCTSPARCSCGATYGNPLGHVWSPGNCSSPAICSICRATGAYGNHTYQNNKCTICNSLQIDAMLEFSFRRTTGNYLDVTYNNKSSVEFVSQNFVVYPATGINPIGISIVDSSGNTYNKWVFEAETRLTDILLISATPTSWFNPKLEFDMYCEVSKAAGVVGSETQVYHVSITGEGTDLGFNTKTYQWSRIK